VLVSFAPLLAAGFASGAMDFRETGLVNLHQLLDQSAIGDRLSTHFSLVQTEWAMQIGHTDRSREWEI